MGWDAHVNNFETVKRLCGVLDPAWATLLRDLKDRGLLETTLVVWMGEFGRTPKINGAAGAITTPDLERGAGRRRHPWRAGRRHHDGRWHRGERSALCVPELLATVFQAVGVDPHKTNPSHGRPPHPPGRLCHSTRSTESPYDVSTRPGSTINLLFFAISTSQAELPTESVSIHRGSKRGPDEPPTRLVSNH